jgi:VIT1/CCC1 family predicted Fe2+/Mn2+ transporter
MQVTEQLTARDRLGTHLRDELGVDASELSKPFQAAWISALSFAGFALVPILAYLFVPAPARIWAIAIASLASLATLGTLGGHLGGAPLLRAALRVTLGGGLAMAVTAGVGRLIGTSVG